jgi:hypothetical protein
MSVPKYCSDRQHNFAFIDLLAPGASKKASQRYEGEREHYVMGGRLFRLQK